VSGQRKALVIANDQYEQKALGNLLAPPADAEALRRVLSDPKIGGFTVQVARNEPSHVIAAQIEDLLSGSRADDVLLLHFSGHGLKSESGELFFAASNTRPDRLRATAVPAEFVQHCMRDSRSRSIVLLLDCCYGGAFAQGVTVRAAGDVNVLDSFPQGRPNGGRGRAVITASSAMEYAFEGDRLADDRHQRPSVFTSALVEGLATGDADRDEDGLISLSELYDYVFDKVREQNPHQTPSCHIELEGELYLARSRRQRVRPAPIPPDLQAALTDTNMYARLGAVKELESRLAGDNLPAAAGAFEALAELARTATRYLAEPAAEALSKAVVRPAHAELHFGRVEQGSASPHQIVALLGPPIARACKPSPSDDWIRVEQVAGGLDVSVDTAGLGSLHGSLVLRGLTGEAVIAIDAEIATPPPQPPVSRPRRIRLPGAMAPPPQPGQPVGQPAPPLPSQPLSGSHLPPVSALQTAGILPRDVTRRTGPAMAPLPADSESVKLQPGQRAPRHQPGNLTPPADEAAQQGNSAGPPDRHESHGRPKWVLGTSSPTDGTPLIQAGLEVGQYEVGTRNQGWHLAAFLLPLSLAGAFALPLLMLKRDRSVRINAILSLEICLVAVPGIICFALADQFAHGNFNSAPPASTALLIAAGLLCAPSIVTIIYCLIQVGEHRQPEIPLLTRGASRLASAIANIQSIRLR
jgi:Caspase domain